MKNSLTLVGSFLVVGGVAAVWAAFLPSLYPVWTARRIDAVALIADRRTSWQLANWLFVIATVCTLAGMAGLTRLLNSAQPDTVLSTAALVLTAVASTLWLANLAFRLTTTMYTVDARRAGDPVPRGYELLSTWAGGLWLIGALAGALALVGYGFAVTGGGPLPAWSGWLTVAFGLLMITLWLVIRDVPPIVWYVAPLALGVTALINAARLPVTP